MRVRIRRAHAAVTSAASEPSKGRDVKVGAAAVVVFTALVVLANTVSEQGRVQVGFGLTAPAGVYLAGLTFAVRDSVHDLLGPLGVLGAIAAAAGLSWATATPRLATASALAFTVSELADQLVYAPLRRRGQIRAIAASNLVGLIADSLLFLWLAFGSTALLAGQIAGKTWTTLLAITALTFFRHRDRCKGRRP